jgi:hypothetical protein
MLDQMASSLRLSKKASSVSLELDANAEGRSICGGSAGVFSLSLAVVRERVGVRDGAGRGIRRRRRRERLPKLKVSYNDDDKELTSA